MTGARPTFSGPGFGTLVPSADGTDAGPPPAVSARRVMRDGLPPIYQESEFAMGFAGALEGVLDPIAAVLDALPAHFCADYASRSGLDLLAAWLGIELDESLALDARRDAVRMAAELGRRRGTARGLQLALRLRFPGIPMRVEDGGGVRFSGDGAPALEDGPARFAVYVDVAVAPDRQAAIARCIEQHKPAEAAYRLRVRAGEDDT